MIKLEHVVLASPEQMDFIIEGMRNPKNSWDKSDSGNGCSKRKLGGSIDCDLLCVNCPTTYESKAICSGNKEYIVGANDISLMQRLAKAGTDHRKYLRMMPVYVRITAGHTWWAEFDTYKVGTVRNSCSKMHKVHVMGFEYDKFDHEGIDEVGKIAIDTINHVRDTLTWLAAMYNKTGDKKYWRAIIELLPMGFHLTANIELNYEVLANMYHSRKNHKMLEWHVFCNWIESLPYSELITGNLLEE